MELSRRGLMKLGGGTAAGLAFGNTGLPAAAGALSLPASPSFDLHDDVTALFMHQKAWCAPVMQCAGYDHLNKHWYVTQVMYIPADGVTQTTRTYQGDLCVTKLSADGTTKLGRMYLMGFGHGAQFGIEATAAGQPPYLWIEYDSVPSSAGVGAGVKLCRIRYMGPPTDQPARHFRWDNAQDRADMNFLDRTPDPLQLPGAGTTLSAPRPVVDPLNRRLLVRFTRNGQRQAAVWDLATAVAAPLGAPLVLRENLPKEETLAQGFCCYGSYMYQLEGKGYAKIPRDPADEGTTYITKIDLNSSATERVFTRALKSLDYREPEGMNIMLVPDPANAGAYLPRLTFGFASGLPGDRRVNIAYKDALI
ncbi:hypothetical protein ACWEPC_16535 [Nonomuraea sp. NPDC004297]